MLLVKNMMELLMKLGFSILVEEDELAVVVVNSIDDRNWVLENLRFLFEFHLITVFGYLCWWLKYLGLSVCSS